MEALNFVSLPIKNSKEVTLNVSDISAILEGATNTVVYMKQGKSWAIDLEYEKVISGLKFNK